MGALQNSRPGPAFTSGEGARKPGFAKIPAENASIDPSPAFQRGPGVARMPP